MTTVAPDWQAPATVDWKGGIDVRRPIASQVHMRVKRAIVMLDLQPNEALSEKDLSLKFGVSRTPVREALIRLSGEGLVDILPQRGTYVSPIRLKDVLEAQFIRETLEVAVIRRVVEKADASIIARLDDSIRQQKSAMDSGALNNFIRLDDEFHHAFSTIAELPRGWTLIQSVKSQLDRVRYLSLPDKDHTTLVYHQHAEIVEAVRAGDADRAAISMQAHLRLVLTTIDTLAEKQANLFTTD